MQEKNDDSEVLTFENSTGHRIQQIHKCFYFEVAGKDYLASVSDRKKSNSLLSYVEGIMVYVLSAKFKQLLSSIKLKQKRTLQSVYSHESLAILSNSFDLDYALTRALEYNIPLVQIVIGSPKGEQIVRERLLINFKVAYLLNENFVVYGDWEDHPELAGVTEKTEKAEQGLYFRMGKVVYAFLGLTPLAAAEEEVLVENLLKVRDLYFGIGDHSESSYSNLYLPNTSDISATTSMFAPNYQPGDSFVDSDEEAPDLPDH